MDEHISEELPCETSRNGSSIIQRRSSIIHELSVSAEHFRAIRSSFIQNASRHVFEHPDIMRGVPVRRVLEKVGRSIRSGGGVVLDEAEADRMYGNAVPVRRFARFISHSWHASGKQKLAAMYTLHNGVAAVLAGLFLSCLCFTLRRARVLPAWNRDASNEFLNRMSPGGPERIVPSGWCVLGYLVGYTVFLVYWQHIRLIMTREPFSRLGLCSKGADMVFFDKLCIHQARRDLKVMAIESIGAFLVSADEQVILWDQTFFNRIWCVFEIAIFMYMNPEGNQRLVPITLYCLEAAGTFVMCFFFIMLHANMSAGLQQAIIALMLDKGVPEYLAVPLLQFVLFLPFAMVASFFTRLFLRSCKDIRKQLAEFCTANAACFDERDRRYVRETILSCYGTEELFEQCVRVKCNQIICDQLGSSMELPFLMIIRSFGVPVLVLMVDWCLALEIATASYQLHWLAGSPIIALLHFPVIVKTWEKIFAVRLETGTRVSEFAVVASSTVVITALTAAWVGTWPWILGEQFWGKTVAILVGLVGVVLFKGPSLLEQFHLAQKAKRPPSAPTSAEMQDPAFPAGQPPSQSPSVLREVAEEATFQI